MKTSIAAGTCMAAALALGTVAFAQSTAQSQPPTPPTSQAQTAPAGAAEQVTITGCVQREDDYRAANNLGKGGAVGTGVGAGNEFVLISATISPATSTVGTSGTSAAGAPMAYELTGENESQVSQFVGKRVEIVGKLKPAEMGAAGATGGATAGKPPAGVDVASKDLKLREVEVTSVKEATGTCPSK